jgi:hypothetical protein
MMASAPSSTASTLPARQASGNRRPDLAVVPGRRFAVGYLAMLSMLLAVLLLGAAFLHTHLAERQFELDRLERSVRSAQDQFDDLRRQRAELRAPNRLGDAARALGLEPARQTEFIGVESWALAQAIASAGRVPSSYDADHLEGPLDQFRITKAISAEFP